MTVEVEPTPRRGRWQVGLGTLALLIATVAAWTGHLVNVRRSEDLARRIQSLQRLARELTVDDPGQAAVVNLIPRWYDENRWDVYLPPGDYDLALATRGVADLGFPKEGVRRVPIAAGRHRVEVTQVKEESPTRWRFKVLVDDAPAVEVEEPAEWGDGGGWSTSSEFTTSAQADPSKPIVLHRRRMMRRAANGSSSTPPGPTEGVLLWVERRAGSVMKP